MRARRVYELTQRKGGTLVIEDEWTARDALVVLVGSERVVASIEAELEARPALWDLPVSGLVRELAAVVGIGRAAAVRFVAAQVYRARASD